jgi:flotillin
MATLKELAKTAETAGASKVKNSDIEIATNSPDAQATANRNWGFIAAQPSEYLIAYRNGQLRDKVSGQGGRCFKLPWDTVALVPTTLKEVVFQANQITNDNVDVRLRGMVIYRISDPLRVYKLINFTSREKGEAKLARMIADMCRSTSKWLVANMSVEECIRRRKEEIAVSLMGEVAQVVSSEGPEGWGVEIVTIDIQDIYVQDKDLFTALQAKFKAEKDQDAKLALLSSERVVTERKIDTETHLSKQRHDLAMKKAQMEATREIEGIALKKAHDEELFKLDRFRVEQNEGIALFKVDQAQQRAQVEAEADRQRAEIKAAAQRALHEEEARALREQLNAQDEAGPAAMQRLFVTEALPAAATAMARSMRHARFNLYQTSGDGDGNGAMPTPFHFMLSQVMDLVQEQMDRQSPRRRDSDG